MQLFIYDCCTHLCVYNSVRHICIHVYIHICLVTHYDLFGNLSLLFRNLFLSTLPPSPPSPLPQNRYFVSRAQILSTMTGVKASNEVGLQSTQAWGCPCSIICLFSDIKSAPPLPFPFLAFSIFLLVVPFCSTYK
jgi:hypothetical protein